MILSPPLAGRQNHGLDGTGGTSHHQKAWEAPNASAASFSASRMTDTGWHRLSRGFMLFTSTPTLFPQEFCQFGFPRPRLWPGTSKGTTRIFRNFFQCFIDGRPILFQPILLFQAVSLPSAFFLQYKKRKLPLAACVLRSHPAFRFASFGNPRYERLLLTVSQVCAQTHCGYEVTNL